MTRFSRDPERRANGIDSMPRLWSQRIQSSAGVPELRKTDHRRAGNGSVQLDRGDCTRNRRRHHPDGVVLNVAVIGSGFAVYGLLKLIAAYGLLHPAWRHHGTDVIAMPVLLAFANLLTLRSPFPNAFIRPAFVAALTIIAALVWEFIAPIYARSTSDMFDVVAYFVGACMYFFGVSRILEGSVPRSLAARRGFRRGSSLRVVRTSP